MFVFVKDKTCRVGKQDDLRQARLTPALSPEGEGAKARV
jgi:hypothetical protein